MGWEERVKVWGNRGEEERRKIGADCRRGRAVRGERAGVWARWGQREGVGGRRGSAQGGEVALEHFPPVCVLVELRQSRSKGGGRDERP